MWTVHIVSKVVHFSYFIITFIENEYNVLGHFVAVQSYLLYGDGFIETLH